VYTVYGSGDVVVESSFDPGDAKLPDLPRFGMQMAMPREFGRMAWYGRGPQESYCDRNTGAAVGVYSESVQGSGIRTCGRRSMGTRRMCDG